MARLHQTERLGTSLLCVPIYRRANALWLSGTRRADAILVIVPNAEADVLLVLVPEGTLTARAVEVEGTDTE